MLPTSTPPTLQELFKNKYDILRNSKDSLMKQKDVLAVAIEKYVHLALESADKKIIALEVIH